MKKMWMRAVLAVLAALMLAGCGKSEQALNGEAALKAILEQVEFDTELSEVGSNAVLYFPDLPAGREIRLYTGSGYFADEAVLLTMPTEADAARAEKVVENHLKELRDQFRNYVPEEVGKIDSAVTVQSGREILLCITNDVSGVQEILKGTSAEETPEESQVLYETLGTLPARTEPTAPAVRDEPGLQSKSGTYHDYGNGVIRVDSTAFERYGYSDGPAQAYADLINRAAASLDGKTRVYDIVIPTAIGEVLPDDIASSFPGDTDQGSAIRKIHSKLSGDVIRVNPYENLRSHRDEYLYFHTDYHWNGRGAYYAYESFCEAKGVSPYTLSQRREEDFTGFLGVLYWKHSGKDDVLKQNPDTVEAFHPYSPRASMRYTDQKGQTYDWNIIFDVSTWDPASRYSTFAGADNPYAEFDNPDVTDGSVAVVVKESYGNALLPYLVDHYSKIYELDYRYWEGDLASFVKEKQADDLIFANNLSMIGSNFLIGKLANIIR